MKKVGVCGHLNIGSKPIGGQTIKTRIISEALKEIYGSMQVLELDTEGWAKNKLTFFLRCISITLHSENIIILPAHNGVKLLMPLYVILAKIFNRKLHYIIVGAWLPDLLLKNKYLIKFCKNINFIYAQTSTLVNKLNDLGVDSNTYMMPNFKRIEPIEVNLGHNNFQKPHKLCMVSRINHKKGIESAIDVVAKLNDNEKNNVQLDIYGPIEISYEDHFKYLIDKHSKYVKYRGVLDYNQISEVIKEYYLLLFPTKYFTEGFPGAILDAYLSGVPVIASRWESWADIIREGVTGYTFEFDSEDDFYTVLKYLIQNEDLVEQMKKNCLIEADKYNVGNAIKVLVNNIS